MNLDIQLIIQDKLAKLKQTSLQGMAYDIFYRKEDRALYVEPFNESRDTFLECGFEHIGWFEVRQDNSFTIFYNN